MRSHTRETQDRDFQKYKILIILFFIIFILSLIQADSFSSEVTLLSIELNLI